MVWKAKTSLAELLRRRKQTLQEWMSQMGMATLDDVRAWCVTNDGVLDIPLPKAPTVSLAVPVPMPSVPMVVVVVPESAVAEEKPAPAKQKPVPKKDDDTPS